VAALTCNCGYVFYPGPAPLALGKDGAGGARRRITPARRRAIVLAISAGTRHDEIAREFGICAGSVSLIARQSGTATHTSRRRITPEMTSAIVAAIKSGKPYYKIASTCDVSPGTVYRVAHKAGLR
jgi:transposase-like protein